MLEVKKKLKINLKTTGSKQGNYSLHCKVGERVTLIMRESTKTANEWIYIKMIMSSFLHQKKNYMGMIPVTHIMKKWLISFNV